MHKQFLLAALEQAWIGRGQCAPNPSVGAVAVRNNQIIAQACHRGAGSPHAEQLLISQLSGNLADVTLYVTLEPCNHWGRTPPCVDSIVKSGIRQVYYACTDPNPLVAANDTPALLKQHGVHVVYYPVDEILAFYHSYRYWTLTGMPWVTAKIAQSFDGKIAGHNGARVQLTNQQCADFTHRHRLHSDIILTTSKTINADDPMLTARVDNQIWAKPLAILDRNNNLNPKARALTLAGISHIYHDKNHAMPNLATRFYHAMPGSAKGLDLEDVFRHIGKLGYHDVWVEAGGILFSELHRLQLVNRTYVYITPSFLGINGTPNYIEECTLNTDYKVHWKEMGDNMIAILDWPYQHKEQACLPV